MNKQIISTCPSCHHPLVATELTCQSCDTKLQGKFSFSKFDYLTPSQQEFILIFMKNAGNIRGVESDLSISYPTVKKMLNEVIAALGFDEIILTGDENHNPATKEEVLEMLKKKKISFEEAEKLIEELQNER